MIIFLPINLTISFECSKELSHGDGSFEYPQHMFWLRNKKIKFWLRIPYFRGYHTFVEIDHEMISTVILLPSADSFKKGCCQLQAKVCARITG